MSEFKGTPGPWEVFQNGFSKCAVKANGHWLTYSAGDDRQIGREEVEANARLIAAAPELLEALQMVLKIIERHMGTSTAAVEGTPVFKARAALAKATGEAQ